MNPLGETPLGLNWAIWKIGPASSEGQFNFHWFERIAEWRLKRRAFRDQVRFRRRVRVGNQT
jgi:hypothetical protein